ncbi:MAG: DoxX family protein [Planctomycetota bacterium]
MFPTAKTNTPARFASWALQIGGAGAMIAMGALPKLTGQFPSPVLFEQLGVEPWGRYAVGLTELAAAVLLLVPRMHAFGGVLLALAMGGAFASHVGSLGLFPEFVNAQTGETVVLPFFISLIFLAMGAAVVLLRRDELPVPPFGAPTPAEA